MITNNCFNFFHNEIRNLKKLKVIVALGKIAFDTCINFYKQNYSLKKSMKFGHGLKYCLPNNIILLGCYHPSPRNVNTGRINQSTMVNLLKRVKKELEN